MITNTQPGWWTEAQHGSAWSRVKQAMKRDWEQTKHDLHLGGRELDQDVDDTVKQAAGTDAIPPRSVPNAAHMPKAQPSGAPARRDTLSSGDIAGTRSVKTGANRFDDDYRRKYANDLAWDDVEGPMAFGFGAREQYGTLYAQWDDALEARLRDDWEVSGTLGEKTRRKWEDVKAWVRMGFDRNRPPTH